MIDTNSYKQPILSTKLKLIPIDFNYVRESNFEYVKKELIAIMSEIKGHQQFFVCLGSKQNILIENYKDLYQEQHFGRKYFRCESLMKNRDIDEITHKLITDYVDWLELEYRHQSDDNYIQKHLKKIIQWQEELFTPQNLADYLLINLDHINGELITIFIGRYGEMQSLYDNFIETTLVKLQCIIKTIKSSTINALIRILHPYGFYEDFDAIMSTMAISIYRIIMHDSNHNVTITFDEAIEYKELITILPKELKEEHFKLPISAIPVLSTEISNGLITFSNVDIPLYTTYVFTDMKDFQALINELLDFNEYHIMEFHEFLKSRGTRTELSMTDRNTILQAINIMTNNFSDVKILQEVGAILLNIINN